MRITIREKLLLGFAAVLLLAIANSGLGAD
jgi:hypothetical protein